MKTLYQSGVPPPFIATTPRNRKGIDALINFVVLTGGRWKLKGGRFNPFSKLFGNSMFSNYFNACTGANRMVCLSFCRSHS